MFYFLLMHPFHLQNSRPALVLPAQGGSEMCHFCNKRVYLMERLSAEGKFFHRGCFRCEYCSTTLRLGSYAFDRDGKYGSRFFCTHHFGMPGTLKMKTARKSEELRNILGKENIPRQLTIAKTPDKVQSCIMQLIVESFFIFLGCAPCCKFAKLIFCWNFAPEGQICCHNCGFSR